MKLVIGLLSMFLATQGFAAGVLSSSAQSTLDFSFSRTEAVNPATSGNPYLELLEYYRVGRTAIPNDLQGIWSGRCYGRSTPTVPNGMTLVASYVVHTPDPNQDNGPLFPAEPEKTTFNYGLVCGENCGLNQPANRYDNPDQSTIDSLEAIKNTKEYKELVSSYDQDSLVSKSVAGNLKFNTRIYSNYIVSKATVLADEVVDGIVLQRAGTIHATCYFFKKIK